MDVLLTGTLISKYKFNTIVVTLYEPPYTNKRVLKHTNWEKKDCKIEERIIEEIK